MHYNKSITYYIIIIFYGLLKYQSFLVNFKLYTLKAHPHTRKYILCNYIFMLILNRLIKFNFILTPSTHPSVIDLPIRHSHSYFKFNIINILFTIYLI